MIMAAAVADFRPSNPSDQKIKKGTGAPTLTLERTSDIIVAVREQRKQIKSPKIVVGFAAETQDLLVNAESKLRAKGLDMIAANDVSASDSGFGTDTNRVTLLCSNGNREELSLMSKEEVANTITKKIIRLLEEEKS